MLASFKESIVTLKKDKKAMSDLMSSLSCPRRSGG